MSGKFFSVATRYEQQRAAFFAQLQQVSALSRRHFTGLAALSLACCAQRGLVAPQTFAQLVLPGPRPLRIAYLSDTHLGVPTRGNDRTLRAMLRAIDDINALRPQPDLVVFGGDLTQLGRPADLRLGAQILANLQAPLHVVAGEHDWYYDLGDTWQDLFGSPQAHFTVRGVQFVSLLSVTQRDFWTARKLTPAARMRAVANLGDGTQAPFEVGPAGRAWLAATLAPLANDTPLVVLSHAPPYKLYRRHNFWLDDAEAVQRLLQRFDHVTVLHGHTHQVLQHQVGNIHFYGMLSTAWPWPHAPEGLPLQTLALQQQNPQAGLVGTGYGQLDVLAQGCAEKLYQLWDRNPLSVPASSLRAVR